MPLADISPKTVKNIFGMAIALTLTLFLINFVLVGFEVFGDGIGYYAPLRSLFFDGDLKVCNEYEAFSQGASQFGGGGAIGKKRSRNTANTPWELDWFSLLFLRSGILPPLFCVGWV